MSGKLKNQPNNTLQRVLYLNFRILKKYKVDTVVENWPDDSINHASSLHKWITGERQIPDHQVSNLVKATGDITYLEYFCNPCGYMVIPEIKDKTTLKMFTHMAKIIQSAINKKENE